MSADWDRFTVRINIKNVPIEKLSWAWASRKGMEYSFLRLSEYKTVSGKERNPNELVEKGDNYKWLWHGWPDETVEHGEILDCNEKDFFKFSFGKAGNCSVFLKEEEGEKIVELLQDTIPNDEAGRHMWHVGCKTGCTFYLAI